MSARKVEFTVFGYVRREYDQKAARNHVPVILKSLISEYTQYASGPKICWCGNRMDITDASIICHPIHNNLLCTRGYSSRSMIVCDGCDFQMRQHSRQKVWHCNGKKHHKQGYDLCYPECQHPHIYEALRGQRRGRPCQCKKCQCKKW